MEHATWGPSGVLPELLPPGDVPPSVPKRVGMGYAPQYLSLPGPGMSPGGTVTGTCALSWEQALLSPTSTVKREQHGPPVCRYPRGGIEGNYPLFITQNNGNLPLSFFGGNYPIVILDNNY